MKYKPIHVTNPLSNAARTLLNPNEENRKVRGQVAKVVRSTYTGRNETWIHIHMSISICQALQLVFSDNQDQIME